MMKITFNERRGQITLRVEGVLGGAWVRELERCWAETLSSPDRVSVDLGSVVSIDSAGRGLLEKMHQAGTTLVSGNGPMTRYIVERIQQTA